jgi:methionyl-tRNA formyltransferase
LALRLVFMGTPDFAVPTLVELVGGSHDVVAVYTRAPQPAGRRGLELTPSAVAREAERFGIPVFTPKTLRDNEAAAAMLAHGADAGVVVAYGLILPKPILEVFPLGCFNLHASLLPRWRGAAPIQRAIMAGDRETGVCVMAMEEGLDTGPVALVERVAIAPETTSGALTERLAMLGADLMTRALPALERGGLQFRPQDLEGATYAKKIDKSEARIDWTQNAETIRNQIHGLSPSPGAYAEMDFGRGPERVKILRAKVGEGIGQPGDVLDDSLIIACGRGAIQVIEAQRAGKTAMSGEALARGSQIARGAHFT